MDFHLRQVALSSVASRSLPPTTTTAPRSRLTLRTAYMLALNLVAVDEHDAAAAARLVPRLAAPATVPAPVLLLERAFSRQGATGREW